MQCWSKVGGGKDMNMMRYNIYALAMALCFAIACTNDNATVAFQSDRDIIEVGANGGVERVKISSK